jgi:hypothetical protein
MRYARPFVFGGIFCPFIFLRKIKRIKYKNRKKKKGVRNSEERSRRRHAAME